MITESKMSMLTDWNESHNAGFQKEIISFGHALEDTGLFSDEALIELLDKHPQLFLIRCMAASLSKQVVKHLVRKVVF